MKKETQGFNLDHIPDLKDPTIVSQVKKKSAKNWRERNPVKRKKCANGWKENVVRLWTHVIGFRQISVKRTQNVCILKLIFQIFKLKDVIGFKSRKRIFTETVSANKK